VAGAAGPTVAELVSAGDRGAAVTALGRGAAAVVGRLVAAGRVDGVLAAGGSGGSSIAAAVLAACPVGLPKLLVSTMASGDVSPYVGAKDVTIMYSVVDVAGVNRISRLVLGNAAAAMAGMARDRSRADTATDARPIVAASMFGVTTPAVEAAKARLEELGYEVLAFHATGAGGRALEGLAQAGLLAGVLDLTTTELADDLVGGVLTAGPDRLTAAGAAGVPQVIAPGALDMVNFGPVELGRRIGAKAAAATGPTEVFWPDGGVSALDAAGQPFADPAADTACRDALAATLAAHGRTLHRVDAHVNAPEFASAMADTLHRLIQKGA
ncbi:Tm-1-like ATP-binding domain-containing protein, partial [Micromonospora sp. DH15]|nr:Tm-1-like ATP-binding domain-containing protein [Micromonospora sp. DH15]